LSHSAEAQAIGEEDALRADVYDLLGLLLARPPSGELLKRVAGLKGDDETALGRGVAALARVARATDERAVEREFTALFIGVGRGELMPYASYYVTGFLNEKPLAALRGDMARLQIARAPNVFEPEDNLASLCEMMAGLVRGRFGEPASLRTQKDFFFAHLAPWASACFEDMARAKNSVLYAPVGQMGAAFVEIEREAFRMGG
jgi:TorA maturation chaperone TorD